MCTIAVTSNSIAFKTITLIIIRFHNLGFNTNIILSVLAVVVTAWHGEYKGAIISDKQLPRADSLTAVISTFGVTASHTGFLAQNNIILYFTVVGQFLSIIPLFIHLSSLKFILNPFLMDRFGPPVLWNQLASIPRTPRNVHVTTTPSTLNKSYCLRKFDLTLTGLERIIKRDLSHLTVSINDPNISKACLEEYCTIKYHYDLHYHIRCDALLEHGVDIHFTLFCTGYR